MEIKALMTFFLHLSHTKIFINKDYLNGNEHNIPPERPINIGPTNIEQTKQREDRVNRHNNY